MFGRKTLNARHLLNAIRCYNEAIARYLKAWCKTSDSSLAPPALSMELHAGNRESLVNALKAHLSASGRPLGIVLLKVRSKLAPH